MVWHGFTPMDEYLAGEPIVVERAEGRELIGVDGRRYLDAISSLWVNTLGHHVPELDEAVRRQLDRVAHSTLLGHGNRVVVELAEALAAVVPVDDPRFLFAGDGASAVEQALKIAFQYWVNVGRPERNRFLAFGGAYHGDTVGALSLGDGGLGADVFDPLRFPVLRAPGFDDDPDFKVAVDLVHEHADELAAVVVEPLVQGAAGMRMAPAASFARLAAACRETGVLLVYDEVATGFGRTGTLFAADQCGDPIPARPPLPGQGPHRRLSGHGRHRRHRPGGRRLRGQGQAPGPRPLLRRQRPGRGRRPPPPAPARRVAGARQRRRPVGAAPPPPRRARPPPRRRPRPPPVRADGRDRRGRRRRRGRRVCAAATRAGVLLRPLGETVVLMPPLTVTEAEVERIVDALAGAVG